MARIRPESDVNPRWRRWGSIAAVPYVVHWSDENEWYVAKCPAAGNEPALFCRGKQTGTPMLGKMNEARQRECMGLRRCQVCRVDLTGTPGYTILDNATTKLPDHILPVPVIFEPPACPQCMRFALENCPGIARRRDSGELHLVRTIEYVPIVSFVGKDGSGDELDRFLATYRGPKPVGYMRGALTKFVRVEESFLVRD